MSIPYTFLASTAAHYFDWAWHHAIVSITKFLVLDLWLFHSVHHCAFHLNPETNKETSCISFIWALQGHTSTLTFITVMLLIQSSVLHDSKQKIQHIFTPQTYYNNHTHKITIYTKCTLLFIPQFVLYCIYGNMSQAEYTIIVVKFISYLHLLLPKLPST